MEYQVLVGAEMLYYFHSKGVYFNSFQFISG